MPRDPRPSVRAVKPESKRAAAPDPLAPPMPLLVKLGSIAVHAEEYLGPGGHEFDRVALVELLADPEVQAWRAAMDAQALLPVQRNR